MIDQCFASEARTKARWRLVRLLQQEKIEEALTMARRAWRSGVIMPEDYRFVRETVAFRVGPVGA